MNNNSLLKKKKKKKRVDLSFHSIPNSLKTEERKKERRESHVELDSIHGEQATLLIYETI